MAAPEVGLPSTSTTDGKFLGLAGVGLQTLTQQSKFFIGLSSAETTFSAAIFDGDLGNSWDNHDPLNSVKTEFVLYADPNRTGDTTGKTPLVTRTSDQLTDNAWADLYNGPVHAAARSFSGNYFYFVVVRWTTEAQSANEFNSFKVKATGQLSITPGQWSFVGAPINLTSDPAFGTAGNSYAGAWDWFVYVPPGVSQVNFTECDADARAGTPPGSPPDDETDVRVAIAPDVRYSVLGPTGSLVINQGIPSGNSVCKTGSAPVTTGGVYRWSWVGVDAHNLIFVDLSYETFQAAATPFAIGTASPTPSATATVTPTVAPTGTPGPTNTAVPTVPVPTMTPTRTPQPSTGGEPSRPTNTPAPLLTPRATLVAEGSPTPPPLSPIAASPVPASPFASPVVPRSTPTAVPARPTMTVGGVTIQVPSRLPRTGDLAPIATGLGSVLVLVAGVRFRRRR